MSFAAPGRRSPAAMTAQAARAAEEPAAVERAPARAYVGLVTRALAFALDAAVINAVAILTAAVVTLTFSVINLPDELQTVAVAVGGAVYVLWNVGYFVTFWATTGQTPGNRILGIRVVPAGDGRLRPRRALLRFAGLWLAALPFFAGYLLILVDDRRRGLHDRLARTVVIEAEREADVRRRARDPRGRPAG
jgi:uncharacterized RDD family membrane protein YckC